MAKVPGRDDENMNKELINSFLDFVRAIHEAADNTTGWEEVPNGNFVLPLDQTNFFETIHGNRAVMTLFHAKWCSACVMVKRLYAALASTTDSSKCLMAAVDCTEEFDLAFAVGVNSLPTAILFLDSCPFVYNGDRTIDDMRNFIGDLLDRKKIPIGCAKESVGQAKPNKVIRPKKLIKKLKVKKPKQHKNSPG